MTQTPDQLCDALNFEGLERRANYRVIAYREDVLVAFDRKDAAATIYQIIYRWLEHKREELLKEIEQRRRQGMPALTEDEINDRMWVYMSYNDFARESGGAISYNTVIAMIHYLVVDKKVVEQRENHDPHFADYEYRINKTVMKELLKALPVKPPTYTKVGTGKKSQKSSTNSGTDTTKVGTPHTNSGTDTTKVGSQLYQNWGTSQSTQYTHSNLTESVCKDSEKGNNATIETAPHTPLFEKEISTTVGGIGTPSFNDPGPALSPLALPQTRKLRDVPLSENGQTIAAMLTTTPRLKAVKKEPAHSPEAIAIQKMYDGLALGPGKVSGHPKWDWDAMEEMASSNPTEEEIRLVYTHLKDSGKKCTIQAVWESWYLLATLRKPAVPAQSGPKAVRVVEDVVITPYARAGSGKRMYGGVR